MQDISERVFEMLQKDRESQTLRVNARFRRLSTDHAVAGEYPRKVIDELTKYLDLVPVYPCDRISDYDIDRNPYVIRVNGVSFHPKVDVVNSIVQTWLEEFFDVVHGVISVGFVCELRSTMGDKVIYNKKVTFGSYNNQKKTINRIVQEIMRVKSLANNIVITCPGPNQESIQ